MGHDDYKDVLKRLELTSSLDKERARCLFVVEDGLYQVGGTGLCGPLEANTYESESGVLIDDVQWHRRVVPALIDSHSGWLVARNSRHQYLGVLEFIEACGSSSSLLHPGHLVDVTLFKDRIYVVGYLNDVIGGPYRPCVFRLEAFQFLHREVQIAPIPHDMDEGTRQYYSIKDVEVIAPDRYLVFRRMPLNERFDIRFHNSTHSALWIKLRHEDGVLLVGYDPELKVKSWSIMSGTLADDLDPDYLAEAAKFRYWQAEEASWSELVELK